MKRKIYCLVLLLTLVFIAGCNKEAEKTAPTPTVAATATPTPTPTPVPENLAKTNLKKLPEQFDTMMSYFPQDTVDYSKGVGYDITLKFSLGQQITELLGLTGLDNISAGGTVDIKEAVAANISLYLNDSEVVNSHLFADSANLLFNLPKYSESYAASTWEQLTNSLNEGESEETTERESSLTGSSHEVLRTINTVDQQVLPTNEELQKLLRSYLKDFEECFLENGITENASIGTGDYVLTGEKHSVSANINELFVILESLETELQNYGEIDLGLEDLKVEGATAFLLDYYISENGDYAWAAYPDNQAQEPLVYVSTSLGFCLYHIDENGTTEVLMYSEKTTEKAGVITIPSSEETTEEEEVVEGTINYEFSDHSLSAHAMFDSLVLTLETSKIGDTILYNVTLVMDGISVVLDETVTPDRTDVSCTLASYGMEYLTASITTTTRDYVEIPIPQNTVDIDTWTAELDQTTLMADLLQLMMDYPFLMDLFGDLGDSTGEEDSEDDSWNKDFWGENGSGTGELPEDSTASFEGLTGYSVDADGFVDFSPLESEVLTLGVPSTGLDSMAITEDQKQALLDYAKNAFDKCDTYTNSSYWIWGNVEFNDVKSYYTTNYNFSDPNSWDNSIYFEFDAISGEFVSVNIYHEDKTTALRMANEILSLLGVDYTITAEIAEDYTFAHNFAFSGYDASFESDSYYSVGFSVYYPEW